MKIFTTKNEVSKYLKQLQADGKKVGFVPTMGALHQGHLSLISQAKQQTDVVVCSIFVNPTQFNDPKDLEKYPRPIDADILKLEQTCCDVLFNPPVTEMYSGPEEWHLNIGELEHLLEGKFRPGHYQGVTQVVNKLFSIINPNVALFGQKDYQQVMVINRMVELLNLPVKIVMCAIEREPDGLAMSSRNIHLSATDRQHALVLYRALQQAKADYTAGLSVQEVEQQASATINHEQDTQLEYFELADGQTLQPAAAKSKSLVALVAARVGHTRLIDNVIIQ